MPPRHPPAAAAVWGFYLMNDPDYVNVARALDAALADFAATEPNLTVTDIRIRALIEVAWRDVNVLLKQRAAANVSFPALGTQDSAA